MTNFEVQKYNKNETKLKDVYSQNTLPKTMKDGVYVSTNQNYWIALYTNGNSVTYFYSFGVEHIPEEIKRLIGKITYDSVICGYFCIEFIDFMFKGKRWRIL